jgi:hypothetical protein
VKCVQVQEVWVGELVQIGADEVAQVGTYASVLVLIVVLLRVGVQIFVVMWSLRADDAGRQHALALLRLLSARSFLTLKRRRGEQQ